MLKSLQSNIYIKVEHNFFNNLFIYNLLLIHLYYDFSLKYDLNDIILMLFTHF